MIFFHPALKAATSDYSLSWFWLSAAVPDVLELQCELESKAAKWDATTGTINVFFSNPLAAECRPSWFSPGVVSSTSGIDRGEDIQNLLLLSRPETRRGVNAKPNARVQWDHG